MNQLSCTFLSYEGKPWAGKGGKSSLPSSSIACMGEGEANLVCFWRKDRKQSLRKKAKIHCFWRKDGSKNPPHLGEQRESILDPKFCIYNK